MQIVYLTFAEWEKLRSTMTEEEWFLCQRQAYLSGRKDALGERNGVVWVRKPQ